MIQGKIIILRPLNSKDIEKFVQWHNNFNIKILSLMHPFPVPFELEKEHLERQLTSTDNKMVLFGIQDKASGELLGYTKLFNINWIHRTTYFGIIIGEEDARGRGVGRETIQLITNYAFMNLNLRKILLEVVENNNAAINLYQKIGFATEGLLKEHVFIDGVYQNVLIMALVRKADQNHGIISKGNVK